MARTIDYGILVNAGDSPAAATAHGKHGSDHRLVVFTLDLDGGRRWRIGLWNARRDRDRGRVAEVALRLLRVFDLDALALNEAQQYDRALALRARRDGATLIRRTDAPGMAHQAILVRPGLCAEAVFVKSAGSLGWRTVRGGTTPPKWILTARLVDTSSAVVGARESGGLRVAVGHRPPTQRWRAGRMTGPALRVLGTIGHARAEVALLGSRPKWRPCLYVADLNATPGIRGRWSPAWVARRVGGRLIAPKRGTHG